MPYVGMNKVFMIGQVASQPRYKITPVKELPRLWFRLCTVDSTIDDNGLTRQHRAYHSVVVWRNQARALSEFLREGQTVAIEGRLASRSVERDGKSRFETEVVGIRITVLDRKDDAAAA